MHSYSIELSQGIAFHNIVTSIIHEHQLDVPAAMKWLGEFGKDRVATFLDGIKELPSWGPEIDAKIQRYVNGMGYLVRGTDAWCYKSKKYWGEKGEEVRTTRIVTLFMEENRQGLLTKEELKAVMVNTS